VHRTRAWAAPRVEHTGQVLEDSEDSVAPKVSALLSSVESKVIRGQQQDKHQPGQRAQQLHQGGPQTPPEAGRTARAGGRPNHRSWTSPDGNPIR
jgi:hypothetical protein